MPSIDPRGPVHLLDAGYESAVSPCNDYLDSDSDVSETSTFTNSPVSCHSIPKPSNNTASEEPPIPSPETEKTIEPQDEANKNNNDVSSISSTDITSVDSDSSNDSSCLEEGASDVACATAKMEEDTLNSSAKFKKSVGFTAMSTLYVFEEEDYDVNKTWYSSHKLRAFRADSFLTVNWMVMKNMDPQEKELVMEELQKDSNHSKNNNPSYCYYSNKYGYDRQKEIQSIAEDANYEFCERGVECRTPVGRYKKNKRRIDAMRVVMLYQHMQRQHRRERKREERRQQQLQYQQEGKPKTILRRHTASLEARRRVEADVDADALSNVYGTYCKESASLALAQGQSDAIAAGMPPTPICTLEESKSMEEKEQQAGLKKEVDKKNPLLKCPSLCDDDDDDEEEDEFMDKLISLSFVSQDNDADDEDSENDSDEHSLSLDDLAVDSDSVMEPEEVSGVVEVELIEDEEKQQHSHRISYEEFSPKPRNYRRKSWSSSNSLPNAGVLVQHKPNRLDAPPTSASFSSLELGDLFFGAVGLNFW
eukprot:CAMPEP_0116126768 /NCGR_PEP_ID=MMETSP0329-20121206/6500_1 /TAXON_ID=697910 /ORGANISM="Pseudo-nitzschia arenysensis, Strain B593" /LENGTH=534 /DNA_ID=CAMNT_0003620857 /DNA_START=244 /DNA_END=1845 /DNA_ORIENTATION=+